MKNRQSIFTNFSAVLCCAFSFNAIALELVTFQYANNSNDIYELRDGTVFKKLGFGYVGYMGYNQEIVFLENEFVCLNGSRYKYKLYEVGSSYHYSKMTYSGAEAYDKFFEICGED